MMRLIGTTVHTNTHMSKVETFDWRKRALCLVGALLLATPFFFVRIGGSAVGPSAASRTRFESKSRLTPRSGSQCGRGALDGESVGD